MPISPNQTTGGTEPPIRLLHLEDSPTDAGLVADMLELGGLPCDVTLAQDRDAFEKAAAEDRHDLMLCDHGIPGYDGFAALAVARRHQPHTPVIILSGRLDDAEAVESLKAGATDYILKQRIARLVPAIRRALKEAQDNAQKRVAEERIRQQAGLLNLTRDAIVVQSLNGQILSWNQGASDILGWSAEEASGRDFAELLSVDISALAEAARGIFAAGDWVGELRLRAKTGEEVLLFSRWRLLRSAEGAPQAILSAGTDITEKRRIEAALLRAQRMDTIGALAGGIAHDLNNALAPVLMSAELLRGCEEAEDREKYLEIITTSARRGTGMVKQILGFVRGVNGHAVASLGQIMRDMAKMARETFPQSITVCLRPLTENLWRTRGDTTELHQILLNLCVNARDAMPRGGQLTLAAQNSRLDEAGAAAVRVAPGSYVRLTVADTGTGIPAEILPRIFEPFFTTKGPDKGTGLGLSTVATLVRQYGGGLDIATRAGHGTEFHVYLPATEASPLKEDPPKTTALPVGHGELILLIEDEEAVRELSRTTLENFGYRVLVAEDGLQGVARFQEHRNEVRALVTDGDMPHLDGMGAVRAIKKLRPDIPVIIASGTSRIPDDAPLSQREGMTNLGKPFSVDQLLVAVAFAVEN